MAELKTTIELYDEFTAPMMDIIQAVTTGEAVLQHLQSVMSQEIDTSTLMDTQSTIRQTTDAAESLADSLQNLSLSSPAMEEPDFKNLQQYQTKLEEAASVLQQISSIQDTIQNQSETVSILPENIQQRLTTVNHSIEQMKANLSYIKQNPFDLDIETAKLEIDSFHDSVLKLLNSQSQLQTAIQHIKIPNPNEEEQVIPVSIKPTLPDPLVENPSPIKAPIQPHAPPEPVEVPIVWKADTLEVFTGSGIERFQQEVQSANVMLEQLSNTQNSITQQAFNTNLFPPQAFHDLNSLAVRIDTIQKRIQQIENNPLNMGTDIANQELEQLRSQLNQAVQEQSQLNTAIKDMDVDSANAAYLRLAQTISHTEKYIRDNIDEQGRFNREIWEGIRQANELKDAVISVATVSASIKGIGNLLETSDSLAQIIARLNLMNDGTQETSELFFMVSKSARNSHSSILATADSIAKMGNSAGAAFTSNQELIAFMDQVNKQFIIGGASAKDQENALLQLSQAMASGALRGDELNSILEAAPEIARAIEKNMGWVEGSIKSYAQEGEVTAQVVKTSLLNMVDETNAAFKSIPTTFSQILIDIQNEVLIAFYPILESINELANSDEFLFLIDMILQGLSRLANSDVIQIFMDQIHQLLTSLSESNFIDELVRIIEALAGVLLKIFNLIDIIGNFIGENWSTINTIIYNVIVVFEIIINVLSKIIELAVNFATFIIDNWFIIGPIIYGIAAALAIYYGAQLAANTINTISKGIHIAMAVAQMIHAAAMGTLTTATAAQIAKQNKLNKAMYACPIMWKIILFIGLIAIIFAVCNAIAKMTGIANSGFSLITGGINVVIQFFKNLGLFILNIVFGIINAIGALATNLMIAFYNAICSIQGWWYGLLSTVLEVVAGICKSLNKLPFIEFDYSGIVSAANDYAAKSKEASEDKEEYISIREAFLDGFDTFETFQDGWISDAFQDGSAWGDKVKDKLSDLFSSKEEEKEDENPTDYEGMLENLGNVAEDINGNTGAIKDSMEITKEDLKYLRDIAEQETINRFTTAEIKIDMSGMQNTVKQGDLDGFLSELTDAVDEAAQNMAEGVYE